MNTIEQTGRGAGKNRRAERGLFVGSVIGVAAAIGMALAVPQPLHAAEAGSSEAEKLRRLDIMLMVTGLRCRTTTDNFIDDYGQFTARHMSELNQANKELRTQLSATYGSAGADRALDRISTVMANEYGAGHPWLSCAELRQVTKSLTLVQGHATLVEAADQLLDRQPRPLLALAGR